MKTFDELMREFDALGIRDQLDYEKFHLYSIVTHSTAIEGSTVSEVENRLLFDEGISANKPMVEQLMNLDLKKAYERAFAAAKDHREIDAALLRELSALVMRNTGCAYNALAGSFDSAKGELRRINVSAGRGGRSYLAWEKVEKSLDALCSWLNQRRREVAAASAEEVYGLSFEAHYRLVSIHPWADGNGRMSRLLMNMIQVEFGQVPSIVRKEEKARYIEHLALAQEREDGAVFVEFMKALHRRNIEEQIEEFRKSMAVSASDVCESGEKSTPAGEKNHDPPRPNPGRAAIRRKENRP